MVKNDKRIPCSFVPPTSVTDKNKSIFSERYVRMRGLDYYLRVFLDGSAEYTRFDKESGMWVHLILPVA